MNTIQKSLFDTQDFAPKDRFDIFEESIGTVFDVSHLSTDKKNFRASITSHLIGEAVFNRCSTFGQRFSRSKARIAKDSMDHYLIQLFLSGDTHSLRSDGFGDKDHFLVIDTSQPWEAENPDFDVLTWIIPRRLLASKLLAEDLHHGQPISVRHPLGRIFADYMLSLNQNIDKLSLQEATDILTPSIDLVATVLNSSIKPASHPDVDLETLSIRTSKILIKKLIDQSLAMPELSLDYICTHLRMSREHVYRVLQDEGGVVSYIFNRRLDLAHRKLLFTQDSTGQIAFSLGFGDEMTFSHIFKQAFGKSPTEIREEKGIKAEKAAAEAQGRHWERWVRAL